MAVIVAAVVLVAGCHSSQGAEPSTITRTATATATASSSTSCAPTPSWLAGSVVPTGGPSPDTWGHLDTHPKATNFDACQKGLGYAILAGQNGDRDRPAGTGSSLFEALAIFVDGKLSTIRPYEFREIRISSATPDRIVASVDTRSSGVEQPAWKSATFTVSGGTVTATPDLDTIADGRLWLELSPQTPATTTTTAAGPVFDRGSYRMLPASQFADGGPGSTFGFALPSGNVICSGTSTSLLCETKFSVPVPLDDTCGVYDRQDETNATMFGWADFDKPVCASLLQGAYRQVGATLPYGTAVTWQPRPNLTIVCYSRSAGLACENPNGYGFTLAREGFTRYRVG
ncbi:hypothetical protein [Gordonia polyisoprenivorans]|uniref:hypothetical protein n=1 Tax=Gordonia polyisoprenivorans TaxID=84595 RepID=UPI001FCCB456|nr:hypothetical protein [Gordonia polyisoprenivorans]